MRSPGSTSLRLLAGAIPLLALALWLGTPSISPAAGPSRRDVGATWTYLQAENYFFGAVSANSQRGVLSGEELVRRLDSECAAVVSDTIGESTAGGGLAQKMREEILDAVLVSVLTPDLRSYRELGTAVLRLSWSSRKLTTLMHRLGHIATATGALRAPDLCTDLNEWAASRHSALPPGASAFLAQVAATEADGNLRESVEPLLRPYEGPHARSLGRRLERLRGHASQLLEAGFVRVLHKVRSGLEIRVANPSSSALLVEPPASVVQAGGKRLEEFDLGRTVAAQSGCLACHRIGEAGNRAPGPDLTHVGARLPGAAIARTLIHPQAPMPSFRNLPKKKFEALVEFLSLLH